eukprot:TRINITY_DN737_c0_g1_i1.p1 TRINITY_DN737_c0_g1~~TRINITY_DN737_c0_g1_i1.p1  ORF type:complete len:434 (-),score=111.49 TRINITY_DN737_c0_g1_i1:72-1373(-)
MSEYDFTYIIGQYLDRHLVFPLLQFIGGKQIYDEESLLLGKLELLSKTNMLDFAAQLYKELHHTDTPSSEITERRAAVIARLTQLQAESSRLLTILEDQGLVELLKKDKAFTMTNLNEQHGVPLESLDALYYFAKFQFECGDYQQAGKYLGLYRSLSSHPEKVFSALWGKFASEILMQNWEAALEDMNKLREIIDAKNFVTPLKQLQQRTWLIHWSLFVFFNHPSGRNGIIDLFFNERYLNAIQTTCPHILRYLTTAVIINKRRKNVLKDLVRVLQQESYTYRDPITEFIEDLYVHFDFEAAQEKLRLCEKVLANDFFLVSCRDEFMENARLCIFENYCRIHQKIDISMLAEKLNMEQEAAERWIVNLIRNARLDAKIDSAANHIIMGSQTPSVYQQVIEKTKNLAFRSYMVSSNLNQAVAQAADEDKTDAEA